MVVCSHTSHILRVCAAYSSNSTGRRSKDLGPWRIAEACQLYEDVDYLKIHADMLKVHIPRKDILLDEMVVHLNVLCPSMEDEVSSKMKLLDCRNRAILDC